VGTRKLVLQGADGVVFVADSQKHRLDANVESLRDMFKNLQTMGLEPESVPLVLQCNKRDLNNIVPVPEMRKRLGMNGVPTFKTVATEGKGIFDALKTIINLVISKAQKKI
jgi:signal recognition particle receptor subunit beta